MKVGDQIRVKESVTIYHYPDHRHQPYDLKGHTGEVVAILDALQGRKMSPNPPVYVQFDNNFAAHLLGSELESIA